MVLLKKVQSDELVSRKQFIITKTDLFNEETAPKDFAWRLFNISQIITTVKVFVGQLELCVQKQLVMSQKTNLSVVMVLFEKKIGLKIVNFVADSDDAAS